MRILVRIVKLKRLNHIGHYIGHFDGVKIYLHWQSVLNLTERHKLVVAQHLKVKFIFAVKVDVLGFLQNLAPFNVFSIERMSICTHKQP